MYSMYMGLYVYECVWGQVWNIDGDLINPARITITIFVVLWSVRFSPFLLQTTNTITSV